MERNLDYQNDNDLQVPQEINESEFEKMNHSINFIQGQDLIKAKLIVKKFNKENNLIEFILVLDTNDIYKKQFSFDNLKKTPCFNFDSDLSEAYLTIEGLIKSNKVKIIKNLENKKEISLIFEEEMTRKKIRSEFILFSTKFYLSELLNDFQADLLVILKEKIGESDFLEHEFNKIFSNLADKITDLLDINKEVNSVFSNSSNNEIEKLNEENKILLEELEKLKSYRNKLLTDILNYENIEKHLNEDVKLLNLELTKMNDEFQKRLNKSKTNDLIMFYSHSKILLNEDYELLSNWFKKEIKLHLLYSSFIHEKKKDIFHSLVDNIPNTLIIIHSDSGRRFGGFTKLKWSKDIGYLQGDGEDFIFSLTKRKIFKNNQIDRTIRNNPGYFVIFGAGHDICLHQSCFENVSDYTFTNFPYSYGVGEYLDEDKKTYLAGSFSFKVVGLEAFKVEFLKE